MNAAWGGISEANELSMCISAGHKTTKNILARKAFTVSMADAAHVVECDYVGVVSANDVPDKLAKAGFHTTKSEFVDAPLIDELAMAVECRLVSYDPKAAAWWARSSISAWTRAYSPQRAKWMWPSWPPLRLTRSTTPITNWARRWATRSKMG